MPRLRSLLLLVLLLAARSGAADWPLPATTPAAAGFSAPRLDALHRTMDDLIDRGRYSGYISLLARDGRIVDWHAHGWQDATARVPLRKDSIVRIYSMSKIITSVAVLTLVEDGRLKLSDPVEKYLPALANRQVLVGGTADAPEVVPAARSVTVLDLLTHTAGYYYDSSWSADSETASELFRRAAPWAAGNLDDFIERVAKLPLRDHPGTRFRYGINVDLLGAIIEKASGRRLHAYLQERIFGPLDLRDTAFWVPPGKRSRLAFVHTRGPDGTLAVVPPEARDDVGPDHGVQRAGGGLYSTAADYARFAQMLLNGGQLDGTRILSRKSVELMRQNHIAHLASPHPFEKPEQGFGLGVRMVTDLGRSPTLGSLGMFGWDGAATSIVWMDPQERTVALLIAQHFPFNQDDLFATFMNGTYAAFAD